MGHVGYDYERLGNGGNNDEFSLKVSIREDLMFGKPKGDRMRRMVPNGNGIILHPIQ